MRVNLHAGLLITSYRLYYDVGDEWHYGRDVPMEDRGGH